MSASNDAKFIERELPYLPPSDAGSPFNFVNLVLEFLLRWSRTYGHAMKPNEPAYCCFVGHDRVNSAKDQHAGFIEREFFHEDTPQDLLGSVYLSSLPFNRVYGRSKTFKNLGECHTEVISMDTADCPIVIFNAAERTVFWRIGAETKFRRSILIDENAPAAKSEDFEELLKQFHYQYTETPQGLTRPWRNASKWQTKPDLEEEIRDDLFIFLRNRMRDNFAVFREFYNSSGRSDLLVCFHLEQKFFYVELKVFRVTGQDSVAWGKSGITQAYTYRRSNESVGYAYACCFDGRKIDEEINELVDFAVSLNVYYRRFFMYQKSKQLQEAIMK